MDTNLCMIWAGKGTLSKPFEIYFTNQAFQLKDERRTSNIQHRPSEIEKKFHGIKMLNERQKQGQEFR